MEACIAFIVLLGLAVIRQEDMSAAREAEETKNIAPKRRRRRTQQC